MKQLKFYNKLILALLAFYFAYIKYPAQKWVAFVVLLAGIFILLSLFFRYFKQKN